MKKNNYGKMAGAILISGKIGYIRIISRTKEGYFRIRVNTSRRYSHYKHIYLNNIASKYIKQKPDRKEKTDKSRAVI